MAQFVEHSIITWRKLKSYLIRSLLSGVLKLGPKAHHLMFYENQLASNSLRILKQVDDGYGFSTSHPRDKYLEFHSFNPRFMVRASDISVDSMTGVITLSDKSFVVESSSWSRQDLQLNVVHRSNKPHHMKVSSKGNILLPSNGFYHWLLEDLPLYLRLQKEKEKVVTNTYIFEFAPVYVIDFLHWMKIESTKISRFVAFEELDFISRGDDTGWPRSEDIQILRDTFSPLMLGRSVNKKIYISRLNATRSTLYESELIELLSADGWIILYPETLSLLEQIREISEAQVLCGLHGAGLAGMVWMENTAKVIEISRESMARACFARLASQCGLNYSWLSDQSDDATGIYKSIMKLSA